MCDGQEIRLDGERLRRMKLEVLKAEQENLRTRRRSSEEMVEQILRIINNEVNKTY